MSAPTTPILDSFNRADETPLSGGGNWGAFFGPNFDSALNLTTNTVGLAAEFGGGSVDGPSFRPSSYSSLASDGTMFIADGAS